MLVVARRTPAEKKEPSFEDIIEQKLKVRNSNFKFLPLEEGQSLIDRLCISYTRFLLTMRMSNGKTLNQFCQKDALLKRYLFPLLEPRMPVKEIDLSKTSIDTIWLLIHQYQCDQYALPFSFYFTCKAFYLLYISEPSFIQKNPKTSLAMQQAAEIRGYINSLYGEG